MTINEAIAAADQNSNNLINKSTKRRWLSELDGRIFYEILYPRADKGGFSGYDDKTPVDQPLLVPYPYDSIYVTYLEKEIARRNSEIVRYNNASVVFNEQMEALRRWHARTHKQNTFNITFPMRRY